MKPIFLHWVALRLAGKLIGPRFTDGLAEMDRAQWLPPRRLQARSDERLCRLLQHAVENVPHYKGLTQIESGDDLRQFPIMRKAEYRLHAPEKFQATNIASHRRLLKTTSGSTGEPFQFELDREALPLIYASHLFYDSWFGLKPFDRYVRIIAPPAPSAPASFRLKHSLVARLQQLYEHRTQKKVWAWEIDAAKAEEISRQIHAFRPHFVMGYTSTLAAIADELLRRGRKLDCRLRGVITIAETLSAERRNRIEEYFEAPIINRYGLREFGSWSAQSCRVSPERFHVNSELVFCEILRPDGTAAAEGETGRVILTDLCNYARPFIRYDTGDLATVGKSGCPCGRGFALIGPIEGRSQECLRTPSGKLISPAVLGHRLFVYRNNLDAICRYQLVWETADFARLLIVPTANWNPERRRLLEDDLSDLLQYEMRVSVEAVSEIRPEKSGKRPIIKVKVVVPRPPSAHCPTVS